MTFEEFASKAIEAAQMCGLCPEEAMVAFSMGLVAYKERQMVVKVPDISWYNLC